MNQQAESTTNDLQNCFRELVRQLFSSENRVFTFTAKSFSELPTALKTDQIVLRKGHVNHDSFRAERLQFFASKSTYRELGLLILSVVFHPNGARVHVTLTHPSSNIRNLIVEYPGSTPRISGHQTIPEKFEFYPQQIATHPWTGENPDVLGFPRFTLTNLKRFVVTEEQWASRDTVIGFGNDDASIRLASLLLNFGSPESDTNEVVLEGEGGLRGVGVHSAEAAFYSPGSLAWPDGIALNSLFSAE